MTPKDEAFALFQKIRMKQLHIRLVGRSDRSDLDAMMWWMRDIRIMKDRYGKEIIEAWRQEWLKTWSDKG